MKREDFLKKLETEEVYLKNEYEGAVVKILKGSATVKFPGDVPFTAQPGSELVTNAILEQNIITKAEFEKF